MPRRRPAKKPAAPPPPSVRHPIAEYAHEDVRELATSFRDLDARKGRLPGLRSALSLVAYYGYCGEDARVLREVIVSLITRFEAEERRVA